MPVVDDLVLGVIRRAPRSDIQRSVVAMGDQILVPLPYVVEETGLSQKEVARSMRRLGFSPIRVKIAGRLRRYWIGKEV